MRYFLPSIFRYKYKSRFKLKRKLKPATDLQPLISTDAPQNVLKIQIVFNSLSRTAQTPMDQKENSKSYHIAWPNPPMNNVIFTFEEIHIRSLKNKSIFH